MQTTEAEALTILRTLEAFKKTADTELHTYRWIAENYPEKTYKSLREYHRQRWYDALGRFYAESDNAREKGVRM